MHSNEYGFVFRRGCHTSCNEVIARHQQDSAATVTFYVQHSSGKSGRGYISKNVRLSIVSIDLGLSSRAIVSMVEGARFDVRRSAPAESPSRIGRRPMHHASTRPASLL